MTQEYLSFNNGTKLELLFGNNCFLGFGMIHVNGVSLRASRRPMFVKIRTPDGVELFDFHLLRKEQSVDSVVLEFSMKARRSDLKDWMAHTVRNLVTTEDWVQSEWAPEATTLRLHLRPINNAFADRPFTGFEYFYEYKSAQYPIYRLLDRSSWAIDGTAVGHSFWLRNCFAPSIRQFTSTDEFYSTEWYLGNVTNPNIFQFQPFQTHLESFTMTTSSKGQLLTIAPKLSHIRSLFEKPRGTEEILHWHEHCGDLATHFITAPIQVLFSHVPAKNTDLINLYHTVKNQVSNDLHQQAGLRRERIKTYGVIEEWGNPNLNDYTDRVLPAILQTGVRCIFLPNEFQNNMNVWNATNMCCTVDYKMESPEKEAKLRRFCDRAREAGAEVQMWGNTALSTLDFILHPLFPDGSDRVQFLSKRDSIFEVLERSMDPYIRNPSGAIEADHYTPVFMALNLRDPDIRSYWHRRWKEAHDFIGLRGIFLDSSFNLSSDKFHFAYNKSDGVNTATADQASLLGQMRPAVEPPQTILSMYFAHLQLIAEMQSYGYHYSGEDIGVFGLRRAGPGLEKRLDNLFLWDDCYVNFDRQAILDAALDPDEVFFRGLAYRLMWSLYWNFSRQVVSFAHSAGQREDDPNPWHLNLIHVFNEVGELMLHRTVLDDETGVIYKSPRGIVLWAFSDFDFEVSPGAKSRDLLSNDLISGESLQAKRHCVYLIEVSGIISLK